MKEMRTHLKGFLILQAHSFHAKRLKTMAIEQRSWEPGHLLAFKGNPVPVWSGVRTKGNTDEPPSLKKKEKESMFVWGTETIHILLSGAYTQLNLCNYSQHMW